jgi:hypothetical protein
MDTEPLQIPQHEGCQALRIGLCGERAVHRRALRGARLALACHAQTLRESAAKRVGGRALAQMWLFFVAPIAGALAAGVAHRALFDSDVTEPPVAGRKN